MKPALFIMALLQGAGLLFAADAKELSYKVGDGLYQSSAIIQIVVLEADPGRRDPRGLENERDEWMRYAEQQKKALAAPQHLRRALDRLIPGSVADGMALLERMDAGVEVEQIRGTSLLRVIVTSRDKVFSGDLANALIDHHLRVHQRHERLQLQVFEKAKPGVPVEEVDQES